MMSLPPSSPSHLWTGRIAGHRGVGGVGERAGWLGQEGVARRRGSSLVGTACSLSITNAEGHGQGLHCTFQVPEVGNHQGKSGLAS